MPEKGSEKAKSDASGRAEQQESQLSSLQADLESKRLLLDEQHQQKSQLQTKVSPPAPLDLSFFGVSPALLPYLLWDMQHFPFCSGCRPHRST